MIINQEGNIMTATTRTVEININDDETTRYTAAALGVPMNGLECPFFTFDEAKRFFDDLDEANRGYRLEWRYGYDEATDMFYSVFADEDREAIRSEVIDGVKVYGPFEGFMFTEVVANDLPKSIELIVEDCRRSYPAMSMAEAVDHARHTISVDNLDPKGTDMLSDAYRAVLAAVPDELIAAEATLVATV